MPRRSRLKRELGALAGGDHRLAFDILNGKLVVHSGATGVSAEAVIQAVARTGMRAETWQDETPGNGQAGFWQQYGRGVFTAAAGMFGTVGFLAHAWQAGVWYVLSKAWRAAIRLRPDMNLLTTIAIIGAAAIGEWFEAVTVAFLFSVSLLLESWSVGRARRAIAALMDLAPPAARVRDADGKETEVPPEEVPVGTVFIVRPAEKIALDGRVVRGASDVNQAPITRRKR